MIENLPAAAEADGDGPADLVVFWRAELDRARRSEEQWEGKAKKILDRYRAEDGAKKQRYNVFWSNVQTLAPAYYAKPPTVVVQRRFQDKDPIGRVACRILERATQYQVDAGTLHETVKLCVFDRLTVGRGQAWLRYDPTITPVPMPEGTGGQGATADDGEPEQQTIEKISWEMVHVDYVHWRDFLHEPGRVWPEVSWVARRAYLTRQALVDRFGDEIGNAIPLTLGPDQQEDAPKRVADDRKGIKASVWEIWNRAKKEVIWIADEFDRVCDQKPDPLKLEEFFPCPRPLYGTLTNDTLVPVPDFEQYREQAAQMDNITARMAKLVDACQVKGAYDAAFVELARILKSDETDLVAVERWAEFASGQGFKGSIDFLPIDIFSKVLAELQTARAETKNEIYEISGISDILRGQGDASETATGVRTKGQYATLRLKDEQDKTAAFVRDIVRLMAEITCELFQPDTLAKMASVQEMQDLMIEAPAPSPMLGHNGGPPMMPQRAPMGAGPGMMQ